MNVVIGQAYRNAQQVELDGGQVTVVQRGSGPPVLLLHGVPLSLVTWQNNIGPLSRTLTAVGVDMRGYGMSAKPRQADYSVPGQARVIEQLIEKLGFEQVSLVGSSYGCAVAVTLAHLAPERVSRLVLINPVCYPGEKHDAARIARMSAVSAVARTFLRNRFIGRQILGSGLRRAYASFTQATPELVAAHHELLTREHGERAYFSTLLQLDEPEVARRIPELTQQTLVIWGQNDRILPASDADRMMAELRSGQFELLTGVGHFPHEEAPDRVNRLISSFLATSRRSPSVSRNGPRKDDADADVRMDGLGRARP